MSWIEEARNFKKKVFKKDFIKMKSYPNKESYQYFKEKNSTIDITYKEYKTIINEYLTMSIDKTIEHRDGFEHTSFGHMIIISRPDTGGTDLNANKKASAESGVLVKHLNLHSGGRICKFIFSNKSRKYKIRHKRLWTFNFSSINKGKISKAFIKNYSRYLRVYKMGHVGKRLMDY